MDKVKNALEGQLEALMGPAMPAEVESRIRRRLQSQSSQPAISVVSRFLQSATAKQIAILLALLLVAGWVFRQQVAPVLQDAWNRTHCWIDPSAKKQ
jgi:hypothetical protein